MHAKKITEKDLAMPTQWLADPKKRSRRQLSIELRAGKASNEWRPPCLDIMHVKSQPPRTYCQIGVPLEKYNRWGLNGVMSYLNSSLAGFPLLSGYVGYSFSWNHSDPRVEDATAPYFHQWLQRHPGLMAPNVMSHGRFASYGLVDLGWITLLGKEYCDRMGGMEALRSSLDTVRGVVVEEIDGGGAMIRIGDAPRLGDTKTGDTLEDYRATGKVISPLRDRELLHRKLVIDGVYDRHTKTIQSKWIDRFFPE
jgi:hypothetical protein